jgi:hypothetical protein
MTADGQGPEMPWTFAVPGRGRDIAWWAGLVRALGGSSAPVISIEHEDPFEQDILARSAGRFAQAAAEQWHNRAFLAERGL